MIGFKPTKKLIESFEAVLKELPKCEHEDRRGCDSFDIARGTHLCSNVATVLTTVATSGGYLLEQRRRCEVHKKPGDKDLPQAFGYIKLRHFIDDFKRDNP